MSHRRQRRGSRPGDGTRRLRQALIGYLVEADGQTISVPRASVTRLERSVQGSRRGDGRRIGKYAGMAIGVGAGIALLAAESDNGSCSGCGIALGMMGLVGAIPGALIGMAVAPGERWVEEDPKTVCGQRTIGDQRNESRVRVGVVPTFTRGGGGLRVSAAF